MDDDDEFGDLYTDVLTPFSSSLSSFQQVTLPASTPTPPPPVTHPISINLQSVDDGGLFAPSNATFSSSNQPDRQAPVVEPQKQEPEDFDFNVSAPDSKADREFEDLTEGGKDELVEISKNLEVGSGLEEIGARVLEGGDVNLAGIYEKDGFELDTGAPEEVGVGNNDDFVWKEVKFGIEEEDDGMIRDFGEDPVIPGLGTSGLSQGRLKKSGGDDEKNGNLMRKDCAGGGDEWDSDDSEDDLQIVLNDNNHGSMSMERRGMVGSDDDDDEDGEPLVIVSDTDAVHQPAEEQEWGEDAGQTADGEGKEIPEAGKVNGGIAVAPKVGYSNFGYHPFHSQFKYVRRGAAPLPSGPPVASGGAPGQVRPPTRIGAIAGHGRGDWRPTGIKAAAPTQKGFLPGFWGSNMSGRGFGGGLEFTLPSHKTIFEVDIDSFEEKPWKYPGIDLSVFFNFGLNEETWKEYCKQLEQVRLESTMQCRIRVYESGRSEQEFDPELPPELAAAAGRDPLAENTDAHKLKVGENDLEKAPCVRPSIPIGKAIQVEVGYSERLPSVDTRPPRYRECDAVIEIVLDGDSTVVDEASAQPDLGDTKGNQKVDEAQEDSPRVGNRNSHEDPHTCHDSKVDGTMKTSQDANPIQDDIPEEEGYSPSPLRSPIEYHDGSSGDSPANSYENISLFEERQTKARTQERSTSSGDGGGLHGVSPDDQEEESTESIRRKHSPDPSSPVPPKDPSFEDIIPSEDEPVQADGSLDRKRENVVPKGTNKLHSTRKQKLSSHVEPLMLEVDDDGDNLKGGKSSESSKATRSSRDPEKTSDGVDEEVIQDGRSIYSGDLKRHQHEDGQAFRRKDCDVRHESETNYLSVKGRGDRYSRREWDPYAAQHFLTKAEGLERRKESDYADGTSLYWRDEDPIKHERADEMIRHRGKIRESERTDKDEQLHSRKLSENGSWRSYDKDAGLDYRDSTEDLHYKRRKDDVHLRWEHIDKEEVLLAHRETSGHRKRERDEQLRDNSNDCHSVRRKDDSWLQRERTERPRERDQWNRSKQSFEESLTRRERDDGRGIARVIHSRLNDDYKGYDKDYLYKDTGRTGELLTRKERVEDQRYSQHRGSEDVFAHDNQFIQDEKRSRPDRFGARSDHVVHPYDSQRVHEKRHKESRKARESEGGLSKRNREQKIGRVEMVCFALCPTSLRPHISSENSFLVVCVVEDVSYGLDAVEKVFCKANMFL
ncbi:hypothetical protein Dimus_023422 [Dionaea muscipula]